MNDHKIFPDQYADQLSQKEALLNSQFATFSPPSLETFASPTTHYRMRAEFKIWHQDDLCHYAMQPTGDKTAGPILMRDFPVASVTINAVMPVLLDLLNARPEFKKRLFQVEFLSTTTRELLITLIYHRPLDDEWRDTAIDLQSSLRKLLQDQVASIELIGRSRKQRIVLGKDWVNEILTVNTTPYCYQQVENSFTQPNASVCRQMLEWATDCAKPLRGDLLELYCGNGNFTIPLAACFNRVFATEISKTSVASAKYNLSQNHCDNVAIARLSSEEFTQAYNRVRTFRRLADINLADYQFSTVFVDPPRAGLDPDTCALVSRFQNILYISCNPNTLADNLKLLSKSHEITRFALFDQFPYTPHTECGVMLTRR